MLTTDFPGGSLSKESACSVGDPGSILALWRSPGEGNGKPTPVLLSGKFHGLRTLVGSSPWSHKESDMTERLYFHFSEWTKDYFKIYWLLVAQTIKNLPAVCETWVWSLGGKDPQRTEWQPTWVFLPGEFHGQRNLVGYSPWGCKELDMTEWLTLWLSKLLWVVVV